MNQGESRSPQWELRRMRDSNPRGREPNPLSKSALRRSVSVQSTPRGGDYTHGNRSRTLPNGRE